MRAMMDESAAPDDNRDQNREPEPARFAVSPVNGARIPLGAHPQNTGGKPGRSGPLPSKVREACRRAFAARVPLLKKIADGTLVGASTADRIRALDVLARYGLDSRTQGVDVADVCARLAATLEVLRRHLPPAEYERLLGEIRPIWRAG
ncbi:MAG: hypothetical protein H0T44_06750 [Gemmatimonadales bacterium]|nr:hypothetical protein [Gemmatimonadales bacterium]